MKANVATFEPLAFAALRILSGATFFFHGAQKILGLFATRAGPAMWTQMWFGGIIELACGALVALGLFTRCAAFVASGTMAVAYIQFHWKLQMAGGRFFPIVNGGELAVVYCFLFLYILAHGPGIAAIDAARGRR
jgi:putative oxidoreductase